MKVEIEVAELEQVKKAVERLGGFPINPESLKYWLELAEFVDRHLQKQVWRPAEVTDIDDRLDCRMCEYGNRTLKLIGRVNGLWQAQEKPFTRTSKQCEVRVK